MEIGPKGQPNINRAQGAQGPGDVSPTDKAGNKKDFDVNAATSNGAEQAGPTGQVGAAQYAKIESRIQEGLAKSMTRDQILDDLVQQETADAFGSNVPKDVAEKVADAFRQDPALQQLFNQIYGKASAQQS